MLLAVKKYLLAIAVGLPLSVSSVSYGFYHPEKESGEEQFSFTGNHDSSVEITMDGIRDSLYGSAPTLDFGPQVDGKRCVNLYTYHGKDALYFYFDVADKKVNRRAIGNNNAQDEDGVEISIDRLLDGGTSPQLDDLRIYLGVSGFSKVIKGTGSGWNTSQMIGFGGSLAVSIKEGTTINDSSDTDTGYALEYRIPYISIFGDANEKTPLAFAFVHSGLDELSGSRTRTGLSGHPTFKIPNADVPNNYIVLSGSNRFYLRKEYASIGERLPSAVGKVVSSSGSPLSDVSIEGYYASNPKKKYFKTTKNNGYYAFDEIDSSDDFIINLTKAGYLSQTITYSQENLQYAFGSEYSQEIVLLPKNAETRTLTGVCKGFGEESRAGFKVELVGYPEISAITNESGEFEIEIFKAPPNRIFISKKGYESQLITIGEESSIGEVEIYHESVNLASPAALDLSKNNAYLRLSRANEGIYLKALTYYPLDEGEKIEVCLNTGEKSSFRNHYAEGDYLIELTKENAFVSKYDEESSSFVAISSEEAIERTSSKDYLYCEEFFISYEAFSLEEGEIFGAASRFYNGEEYQDSVIDRNIARDGEIDFASTATYIRFDEEGNAFFGDCNRKRDNLYYYHAIDGVESEAIPTNADHIYMTYDRDEEGIDMDIRVDDGFSTHFNPAYLTGDEAINVVLNIDGVNLTAWALYKAGFNCFDINLRIYSDDTICYVNSTDLSVQAANQLWWSDKAHNNGTAKNFTLESHLIDEDHYEIDYEPGYRTYHLHFSYADLCQIGGAKANTVLDKESPISASVFEISETSKTTVRFYTSSGDAWIFQNGDYVSKNINYSSQSTYLALEGK